MYNLFRKSIILIAGFGLLFLSGCTTVIPEKIEPAKPLVLSSIFSKDREALLYLNLPENDLLIQDLLDSLSIKGAAADLVSSSNDLFLGFNKDFTTGFDAIITGNYTKWKIDLGLFFSLDWKKITEDGVSYWHHKDGINLYIDSNDLIIISSLNMVFLVNHIQNAILDSPTDSIVLLMPHIDDAFTKKISKGFIKGGVEDLELVLNKIETDYSFVGTLGFESKGKAKGFSLLLKMFLKLMLSGSEDEILKGFGKELEITSENNLVIIDNISINEKYLSDFINNIIFLEGDADK